jgi:hypothetical protein
LFVSAGAPFLTAFLFENAGVQAATGTILAAALLSAICLAAVSRIATMP